ncbi:MAG TPA: serine/threonine-protein kinase [Candidatus Obscuribacterales bacterium]
MSTFNQNVVPYLRKSLFNWPTLVSTAVLVAVFFTLQFEQRRVPFLSPLADVFASFLALFYSAFWHPISWIACLALAVSYVLFLCQSHVASQLPSMPRRRARSLASTALRQLEGGISYTEIWLDALWQPPQRNRMSKLVCGNTLCDERFTVIRALGTGGQGTAYLAEMRRGARPRRGARHQERFFLERELSTSIYADDLEEKRLVVLKEFILPGFSNIRLNRELIGRIQHEAMLLKRLHHENIVNLLDFFMEDHRGYLVLEHVDGISLRALVAERGPLNEEEVMRLAMQMCDILSYLHSQSPPVVHRDFTPENLILTPKGLKLIDFNLAESGLPYGSTNCVGKPSYTPPEQIKGKPSRQSDLYAMGATICFLITGEDPEPLTVSAPRKKQPSVGRALDAAVRRLTQQDEKLRFASASEASQFLSARDFSWAQLFASETWLSAPVDTAASSTMTPRKKTDCRIG